MTSVRNDSCPALEELSAWYDKELRSDAIEAHVADCGGCREIIDDFSRMENEINRHLRLDDRCLSRMRTYCLRMIVSRQNDSTIIYFPVWLKIAACVALVALIVVLRGNVDDMAKQQARQSYPGAAPEVGQLTETTDAADSMARSTAAVSQWPEDNSGHVHANAVAEAAVGSVSDSGLQKVVDRTQRQIAEVKNAKIEPTNSKRNSFNRSDISLVGFRIPSTHKSRQAEFNADSRKTQVDDYVQHVWVVDDPLKPLNTLKEILPGNDEIIEKLMREKLDRYHLQFRISDNNLQELVNHFARLGCTLLSPSIPQPADASSIRISGKVVQYDVDFVRK